MSRCPLTIDTRDVALDFDILDHLGTAVTIYSADTGTSTVSAPAAVDGRETVYLPRSTEPYTVRFRAPSGAVLTDGTVTITTAAGAAQAVVPVGAAFERIDTKPGGGASTAADTSLDPTGLTHVTTTNVQAAVGELDAAIPASGTSGGTKSKIFAFDHTQHAALAAGVSTGVVIPAGSTMLYPFPALSFPVGFDGTTPKLGFGYDAASAIAGTLGSTGITDGDSDLGGGIGSAPGSFGFNMLHFTTETTLWIAVTDGAAGDPGSTVGEGIVVFQWEEPTP